MATNRMDIEPLKPLEVLGAFFGYFAVIKDIPDIFRTLRISRILPYEFKNILLHCVNSSGFWLDLLFTILVFTILFWFLPRKANLKLAENSNDEVAVIDRLKKVKAIRIIKTLGFALLRDFCVSLTGVEIYGTFKRPYDWDKFDDRFSSVDRLALKDKSNVEYQYSKDFLKLFVRVTSQSEIQFGTTHIRAPNYKDLQYLIFSSDVFVFWMLIHYPVKFFKFIKDFLVKVIKA